MIDEVNGPTAKAISSSSESRLAGSDSKGRAGLGLGLLAVLFWSFGASLVFLGAQQAGPWPFVAISSIAGGVLQMLFQRCYRGELRTTLWLPWRLWAVPVVCFVVYGLAWPWALASSGSRQVCGVSLINYFWPVLTVLFSAWLVPGAKLGRRTVLALVLVTAGLICANFRFLRDLASSVAGQESAAPVRVLPYGLALLAAVTWAIYSAVLARWRAWAKDYVTSPVGFLLIGLISGGLMMPGRSWRVSLTPVGMVVILLYGAGPLAAGYLLWEIALSKAKVQTLGIIAAGTPILSTLFLCVCLKSFPNWELILAASLVSVGVVLTLGD